MKRHLPYLTPPPPAPTLRIVQLVGSYSPDWGLKPCSAVKVPGPNHWTSREFLHLT